MSKKNTRVRWGWLYPVLPLSVGAFWLIDQFHASAVLTAVLVVLALLVMGGYLEVWLRANTYALEHEAGADAAPAPLYHAWEAVPARPARSEDPSHTALFAPSAPQHTAWWEQTNAASKETVDLRTDSQ
jgi:hypothetical protein